MTPVFLDVQAIVARAQLGDALDDVDFFWIGRFAATHGLTAITEILSAGMTQAAFYLDDAFNTALAPARQAYAASDAAWNAARSRLAASFEKQLGFYPERDEFIMKRGAITPLPPGLRVVRATATFLTLALQPDRVLLACEDERYRAFSALRAAEAQARRTLAESLVRRADDVRAAVTNAQRAPCADGEGA